MHIYKLLLKKAQYSPLHPYTVLQSGSSFPLKVPNPVQVDLESMNLI